MHTPIVLLAVASVLLAAPPVHATDADPTGPEPGLRYTEILMEEGTPIHNMRAKGGTGAGT